MPLLRGPPTQSRNSALSLVFRPTLYPQHNGPLYMRPSNCGQRIQAGSRFTRGPALFCGYAEREGSAVQSGAGCGYRTGSGCSNWSTVRFAFDFCAVGPNPGCATAAITQVEEECTVYGMIGFRTPTHREGRFDRQEYGHNQRLDVFICANRQLLNYRAISCNTYRQHRSHLSRP